MLHSPASCLMLRMLCQVLVADGNQLQELGGAVFRGPQLRRLTSLSLTNCRLQRLADTAFSPLTAVTEINLSNNNLTTLSPRVTRISGPSEPSNSTTKYNISAVPDDGEAGAADSERQSADAAGPVPVPPAGRAPEARPLAQHPGRGQPQEPPEPRPVRAHPRPPRQPPRQPPRAAADASLQNSGENRIVIPIVILKLDKLIFLYCQYTMYNCGLGPSGLVLYSYLLKLLFVVTINKIELQNFENKSFFPLSSKHLQHSNFEC